MKELQQYQIQIQKLENKRHEYQFEGGDAFFEAMEQNLIERGHFNAHVFLDKSETMLHLTFHIQGNYELICDRTLDSFEEPFETEHKLILKYGDKPQEISDEIEVISWDTQGINLARYIFEFIGLTVPMKKLHPRLRQEEAEEDPDDEREGKLVYSSKGENAEAGIDPNADNIDPRWQALMKLKQNGKSGS
ncbi:MAG: DUF177 domain-containing protein [Cytophagaceae bacterium]|nr:DUF177 domain-containing protein [Cytophagaceae bacterium]